MHTSQLPAVSSPSALLISPCRCNLPVAFAACNMGSVGRSYRRFGSCSLVWRRRSHIGLGRAIYLCTVTGSRSPEIKRKKAGVGGSVPSKRNSSVAFRQSPMVYFRKGAFTRPRRNNAYNGRRERKWESALRYVADARGRNPRVFDSDGRTDSTLTIFATQS